MAKRSKKTPQDGVCSCTPSPEVPGMLSKPEELGDRDGKGRQRKMPTIRAAAAGTRALLKSGRRGCSSR